MKKINGVMKRLDTIQYEGKTLAVLVQTFEDETKAYVSYFINGDEIGDWSRLVKRYQDIFTVLSDNLCEGMGLAKWSY
jgi:hypothetical protein